MLHGKHNCWICAPDSCCGCQRISQRAHDGLRAVMACQAGGCTRHGACSCTERLLPVHEHYPVQVAVHRGCPRGAQEQVLKCCRNHGQKPHAIAVQACNWAAVEGRLQATNRVSCTSAVCFEPSINRRACKHCVQLSSSSGAASSAGGRDWIRESGWPWCRRGQRWAGGCPGTGAWL